MTTAIIEDAPSLRAKRKTESIRVRTKEVYQEYAEIKQSQVSEQMQSLVFDCAALARQWRSLVEDISASAQSGNYVDYRSLREDVLAAAKETLDLFKQVADLEAQLTKSGYHSRNSDSSDLTLAIIEAPQIVSWIESWPMAGSARRDAARRAIANSATA